LSDNHEFGRLVDVEPRQAWANEALNFTPWLANNLDRLSEAVGIPLELTGQEVSVGRFSADILARNPVDDQIVLIENQLAWSDHTHLGQILTYLAGTDAQIVIWLAPYFREEHLSAIHWLNQNSQDQFSFFAVRLRVVQIADSPLAPLFDVLEKPNAWERSLQKSTKANEAQSGDVGWRRQFWDRYVEKYPAAADDRGGGGHGASRWRDLPDSGLVIARWVGSEDVGVFVRGDRGVPTSEVRALLQQKSLLLEDQLGAPIGDNSNYPFLKRSPITAADRTTWDSAIDWLERQTAHYELILSNMSQGEPT